MTIVPKTELLNVLGDKYEFLASQDELFQKAEIVLQNLILI